MPCDSCIARCALMCGHTPCYSYDAYNMEDNTSCEGFEFGDPPKDCDTCTRCSNNTELRSKQEGES